MILFAIDDGGEVGLTLGAIDILGKADGLDEGRRLGIKLGSPDGMEDGCTENDGTLDGTNDGDIDSSHSMVSFLFRMILPNAASNNGS